MKHSIYIITDANRSGLNVGTSSDVLKTLDFYRKSTHLYYDTTNQFSRLVYFEEFDSHELALKRLKVLGSYTRMQKERLVKQCNPNWIDLSRALEVDNIVNLRTPHSGLQQLASPSLS